MQNDGCRNQEFKLQAVLKMAVGGMHVIRWKECFPPSDLEWVRVMDQEQNLLICEFEH